MKTYIIEYTVSDESGKKGFCIICNEDRKKAIRLFYESNEQTYSKVDSINQIKNKKGIIFDKQF